MPDITSPDFKKTTRRLMGAYPLAPIDDLVRESVGRH